MNTEKAILERREKPRNKPTDREAMDLELTGIELELEAELIKIMGSPCPTKSFRREDFVNSISTQTKGEINHEPTRNTE